MKSSEPPAIAEWILEHIYFGYTNDALIGDLQEAFKLQGRSQWWYWRQVFVAIFLAFSRELRAHWLVALRAIGIGLFVSYGAQMLGHEALVKLHHKITPLAGAQAFAVLAWIGNSFFCGLVSGSIVGLFHRRHRNTMLLVFAAAFFVWESVARFYVNDFHSHKILPFAMMFYLSALPGVFIGGLLFNSRPNIDRRPTG